MAQIQEQTITIKLSKLVRAGEKEASLCPDGFEAVIEEVVTGLVEDKAVIVEVVED